MTAEDDPIDYLSAVMDERRLAPRDLLDTFGTRARVWEVLNRKRRLTLAQIRSLVFVHNFDAKSLLREY